MKKPLPVTALCRAVLSFPPARTGGSTYYVSTAGLDKKTMPHYHAK